MKRKLLTLSVLALVFSWGATTTAQASESVAQKCPNIVSGITFYQNATWKWQNALGAHSTRTVFRPHRIRSCEYASWVGDLWRARAKAWRVRYQDYLREQRSLFSRLYNKWSCIHRYEGAWNANTGNGYYGGLQMDVSFQRHYGPEFLARYGTADKWPVIDQLIAAERAYSSGRGYYPWPNTARACGLI